MSLHSKTGPSWSFVLINSTVGMFHPMQAIFHEKPAENYRHSLAERFLSDFTRFAVRHRHEIIYTMSPQNHEK